MSDVEPLPDSDDPFEVLGVKRGVDEVALRRAYVRLIKIHRPDRSPEAFARVRQAFETARNQLHWYVDEDEPYEEGDDDEAGAHPDPIEMMERDLAEDEDPGETGPSAAEPSTWRAAEEVTPATPRAGPVERIGQAWRAFGEGGDVRELLLQVREPWDDPRIALHRVLLCDAGGLDVAAEIEVALKRGAPVAHGLEDILRPDELAPLVRREVFAWETLRRQSDRDLAARLMRKRLHARLVDGEVAQAVAEVLDTTYLDDMDRHPVLEWAAREVAAVATWLRIEDAERIVQQFHDAHPGHEAWLSPEDHQAAAVALAEPFEAWRARYPSFEALHRFFVMAPMVEPVFAADLAEELAADFLARAGVYPRCFHAMEEASPELLVRFVAAAQGVREGEDEEEDDTRAQAAPALAARVEEAYREREAPFDTVVRHVLQPGLAEMAAVHGVSPERLLELADAQEVPLRGIQRFGGEIRAYGTAFALYECSRLARWVPRPWWAEES